MRFICSFLLILTLSSCSLGEFLFSNYFEKGYYSYHYSGEKKYIDFKHHNWLIASYDQDEIEFFKEYLGDRLSPVYGAKDSSGKLLAISDITPETPQDVLKKIGQLSNYTFLICFEHSDTNIKQKWNNLDYTDHKQTSTFYVYNLAFGNVEYQITCNGSSDTDDDRLVDIDTRAHLMRKIQKIAVYK